MRRVFLIISLLCLLPFSMMAQAKGSSYDEKLEQFYGRSPVGMEVPRGTFSGGDMALEFNYGYGLVNGQFVKFDPSASFTAPSPAGMQFDGFDFVSAEVVAYNSTTDHIYAYTSDGRFCLIDPQSGEISVLNTGVEPMTELAYDTYTKTMYGLHYGTLFSVNMADGTTAAVNNVQTGSNNWVAMAINNDGAMYAIMNTYSGGNADLYYINTVNWSSTRIGRVPLRTEFAQSMAFNRDNGNLYWWQTSSGGNNFLQINPTNAVCSMIWPNNGYNLYGMFFKYAPKTYNITYATVENGAFSGPAYAAENDEVTVVVTPEYGYRLGSLTWNGNAIDIEEGEPYVFTMPDVDVLVSGSFLLSLHNITVIDPLDGTLATDPANEGFYNTTIQVLPTPDPGFGVQSITYTGTNTPGVTITSEPWEFTMPDYDVTVNAVYAQTGENTISIATDYYGYFDDIVTIAVDLTNDNLVAGTEMIIDLGENLTFMPGTLALSERAEAASWTVTGNMQPGNKLKVTTFNLEKAYYAGNEGTIFTFQVKCARVVSINDLTITGLVVGTPDATGLEVGISNGQLQILDVEMNQPESQVVCNQATTAAVAFSSEIAESEGEITYHWTNDNTTIGLAAEGDGDIAAFTAINEGNEAVVANLTVTPTLMHNGNPCVGSTLEFTITVNPTGFVNAVDNIEVHNGDLIPEIVFTTPLEDGEVTYAWENDNTEIGLDAAGEGNIPAFTAINELVSETVVANVTVTPTYTNEEVSCVGEPISFTITVLPTHHYITVLDPKDGTLATDPAEVGTWQETVTVLPTPDPGFGVGNITVAYNGEEEVITAEPWEFVMPDYDVTVSALYVQTGVNTISIGTDYYGYFDDIVTVAVELTNDNYVAGTGLDIALGENLTFVEGSLALTERAGEGWEIWGSVTANNVLKVNAFNGTLVQFEGNEGAIFTFQVQCARVESINALAISNVSAATPDATNLVIGSEDGQLEIKDVVMDQPEDQVVCNNAMTEAIEFTTTIDPAEGPITYNWTNDNTTIGLVEAGEGNIDAFEAINAGDAMVVANLTVTPTLIHNGNPCVGSTKEFTITVNPTPVMVAVEPIVVCNGEEIAEIVFADNTTDGEVTYAWTNNNTEIGLAEAGEGNIAAFAAINTGVAAIEATISVVPTYINNGISCVGEAMEFTITVNPTPVMEAVDNQVVCNGEMTAEVIFASNTTDGTMNYLWTCDNDAIGCEPGGQDEFPAFAAVNEGNEAVTATFTVTPYYTNNGITCIGEPVSFTITVNPTPVMVAVDPIVVCNGDEIAEIVFADNTTDGTVVYNWTNDNAEIGLAEAGEGNIAAFAAVNAGNAAIVATISVVPTYTNNGVSCVGEAMEFTITVNPTPVMVAVEPIVVCNGAEVEEIVFADNTTDGTVVYNWTNNNTEIGLAEAGEGNIAAFAAVNTGTAAIVATISVVPTYTNNGVSCVGEAMEFTITVNPTPVMEAVDNQVVCNGEMTAEVIFASNTTDGTMNYLWTCDNPAIGCEPAGQDEFPAFAAVNEGNEAVTATFTVTPYYTNNGITCIGEPVSFTITVNPTPVMEAVENIVVCNGDEIAEIVFADNTTDGTVVYNWTNDNAEIGLAEAGEGNIAAFAAVNAGNAAIVATISVVPTYTNNGVSCVGEAMEFTITVNPTPVMVAVEPIVVCNGAEVEEIVFADNTTDGTVVYNWTNNNTEIGLAEAGEGNIAAFAAVNTGTAAIMATISVVPTYTNNGISCVGEAMEFTITVNPTPVMEAVADQVVCNGEMTAEVIFASNTTDGTMNYLWTCDNPAIGCEPAGQDEFPAFAAVNEGNEAVTATFTVTPYYTNNGITCIGEPVSFTITVNPTPVMEAVENIVVCNGEEIAEIVFADNTTDGTVVYNWTNDNAEIGLAEAGEGNIAAFAAVNAGDAAIVATISVVPTYTNNGVSCVGEAMEFTITVNPTPVMVAVEPIVVCNGAEVAEIVFADNTTDGEVVYNWTNNNAEIGLAEAGEGNIAAFNAINAGTAAIVATISVVPTYTNNGVSCVGEAMEFTITVNPTPVMEAVDNQVVCNGEMTAEVIFATNLTDGTMNYLWTCDNPAIGCEPAGQDEFPAFAAVNEGNEAVTATFTVLPVYTNSEISCLGEPVSFTITVNPAVVMDAVENMTVCDDSEVDITFTTPITDGEVTYAWVNDNAEIGLAEAGEGDINFVAVNANGEPVVANITVTPTYINNGVTCVGEAMTFTVTVYPTAVMDEVADQTIYSREYTEDIIFTSNITDNKVVFNWVNDNPAIGLDAEGTGNILSFMGAAPITSTEVAHITVTPSYIDGMICNGASITFTITVEPTYLVTIAEGIENGTLTDDARVAANGEHYAPAGETITLTATPAEGYFLENVTAYMLTNNLVNVPVVDDQFFTMPAFDVECNATFIDGDNLLIKPAVLDLGYRPIGYWMYSKFFDVTNISDEDFDVTQMDLTDNSFFALDEVELPYTIAAGANTQFGINHTALEVAPGLKNTTLAMIASHNRKIYTREVIATAYEAQTPDVWELAEEVTEFPYVNTQATEGVLYDNYQLPGETPDGYDGVYKLVFDHDVILNAAVTEGNDPKVVLYDNGFRQVGGPHINNYHDAPLDMDNVAVVGEGSLTSSYAPYYVYYNYSMSQVIYTADELAAAGLMAGKINSIEYMIANNLYNRDNISIWMANVSNTSVTTTSVLTADMPLVYTGSHTQVLGWNEFVFNGDPFYWDGTSSILVTFLMNHGSYNSSPTLWAGTAPGFAATSYAYRDGSPYSPATDTYTMNVNNNFRPNTKFNGEPIQSEGVIADGSPIVDLGLFAGTYYLVASTTSEDSYTVEIDVEDIPLPLEPVAIYPAHGANGVETPVTFEFELGEYTHEYQLLLGTQYNNQQVVVDWTSSLTNTFNAGELLHNTIYYWRINERNSSGVTEGPLWVFTTELNVPQNLTAEDYELYEGEDAILHWDAAADRSILGYNVYQDGVKINDAPLTETTYTVEGLTYNMDGYDFAVTAAYDEGESTYSNVITIEVSGYGFVSGHVYEQDGTTGIADATVTIIGFDEFGALVDFEFTTDENGAYSGEVLAGYFFGMAQKEGYQTVGDNTGIEVVYATEYANYDFIMNENYNPVARVVAEEIDDTNVHVYWGWDLIEDFETGDLSAYDWVNDGTYPWVVTTTDPYEGTYCIKSTNAGVASSTSAISITMMVANDGMMSFYAKISSEASYDKGQFLIDGVTKTTMSGAGSWTLKEYAIEAGTHTLTWNYTKDGSVNSNDDCFYIDYINFWYEPEPIPEGQLSWNFETGMQGWTAIDADGDGHNWDLISSLYSGTEGHDSSDGVASQSYASGALTPDNWLVSPQIEIGGEITFWAAPYMSSWSAEHFGVFVSTTGTNPSDFTMVWETTYGSKGIEQHAEPRDNGPKVGEWVQYSVDLNAYAGQTGYVAIRHFNCTDEWAILVDDIVVNPARGARSFQSYNVYRREVMTDGPAQQLATGVIPMEYNDLTWGNVPAGIYQWGVSAIYEGNRGESEIVWSNKLDKDMNAVVNVTVTTNSNDPVTGAVVTLTNVSEPNLNLVYNTTLDETGTFTWEAFRKGEYNVTVTLNGFEPVAATETIWNATNDLTYVLTEIIANIEDLYVSTTGWAMFGEMPTTPVSGNVTVILRTDDVWGDGSGYQMLLDADANAFGTTIPETGPLTSSGNASDAVYAEFEYKIPENADGNLSTQNIVLNTSVAIQIPAGVYDWCITNPTPGDRMWIASGNGSIGGRYDDFTFEAGKTYEFHVYFGGQNDATDLTITDGKSLVNNTYAPIVNVEAKDIANVTPVDNGYVVLPVNNRSIEYYNVKLDGVLDGTTTLPFFQHNVEGLVEGETYTTSVQRVYTTGESEWATFDWVYTPCDNFAGLQGDPTAEWQGHDVVLNWVLPAGGDTPVPPVPGDGFSFGFEEDPTANGWAIQALNATTWVREGTVSFTDGDVVPHEGSYQMRLHWAYGDQDEWLITPEFGVPSNAHLTFWTYGYNGSTHDDHYYVKISTNGGSSWTQLWDATTQSAGENHYASPVNVDLSSYAGQNVKLAWQGWAIDGLWYDWFVDDVTVSNGREAISFDGKIWTRKPVTKVITASADSYSKGGKREVLFSDDFESGDLNNWTLLDLDADPDGWVPATPASYGIGNAHSGTYCASSWSWNTYSYDPDHYMISPDVTGAGNVTYFVATNTGYPDHYGIFVSSTGTNASDFTLVFEETAPAAKGAGEKVSMTANNGTREMGAWVERSIDLPAGTKYVAFRHYNSYDMNYLFIDDVTITSGGGDTPVDPPTPAENIIGVEIFRNGEWIAEVLAPNTTYTDVEQEGENTYEIRVVYDGPKAEYLYYAMSCPQAVTVPELICIAPENLEGDYVYFNENDFGAFITWTYSGEVIANWYQYDNGENDNSVGLGGGAFKWAVMYPAGSYEGGMITKVSAYDYMAMTGTVGIYTGTASAPQTELATANVEFTGSSDFVDFNFDEPVMIDPSQNIWVVFDNVSGATYPAATSVDITNDPNGRWVYIEGYGWLDLAEAGVAGACWMIHTYISEAVLFNIYRDGELIATVPYSDGDLQYFDQIAIGTYEYQVTCVTPDCESDFALTPDLSQDYVSVFVTNVTENIEAIVYPNPTTGNVTIEANGMTHITVMSTLGQILYDANISGDQYRMNLAQFQAGVYMVRIQTESGVSVKRVTVAK